LAEKGNLFVAFCSFLTAVFPQLFRNFFQTRLWLKNATFLQSFVASLIKQIRAEKPLILQGKTTISARIIRRKQNVTFL
jgi:hypothetical protein